MAPTPVAVSAPTAFAYRPASAGPVSRSRDSTNPALNASPAPAASTASISQAGTWQTVPGIALDETAIGAELRYREPWPRVHDAIENGLERRVAKQMDGIFLAHEHDVGERQGRREIAAQGLRVPECRAHVGIVADHGIGPPARSPSPPGSRLRTRVRSPGRCHSRAGRGRWPRSPDRYPFLRDGSPPSRDAHSRTGVSAPPNR